MNSGRKTVLVVDDEAMVRLVSIGLVEDLGFEVLEADAGDKALDIMAQRPDIALLFTDCRMPGMSGPQLAQAAVARHEHLRVILVSGYVGTIEPLPWPLIAKPFSEADLRTLVTQELSA
jgi:CheY-like chemotaxis protein